MIGIVSANMISYSLYVSLPEPAKERMVTAPVDRILDFAELFLIEGKFYTIFSLLFGIGFSVLLTRHREKASSSFHRFFLRRMLLLFLIGVTHALLFWHNDILLYYAVCGVLLVFVSRAKDSTILLLAAAAFVAPAILKVSGALPENLFLDQQNQLYARFEFSPDRRNEIAASGGYTDIVRLNTILWFKQLNHILTSGMFFKILSNFLIGFYVARNGLHKNLETRRPVLKRVAIWGFAIGVPLNLIYAATFYSESWLLVVSETFGVLPLSAAYAASLCLLWLSPKTEGFVAGFAPVGRMALTNYVGQSVICTFIFYGWGLGWGGAVGPSIYLPMALVIFALQVAASRLWLARFQFGPLEWLWRSATYGAPAPMRKISTAA